MPNKQAKRKAKETPELKGTYLLLDVTRERDYKSLFFCKGISVSLLFSLGSFSFIRLHYSLPEFPRGQLLVHFCSLFKKLSHHIPCLTTDMLMSHNFLYPYASQVKVNNPL